MVTNKQNYFINTKVTPTKLFLGNGLMDEKEFRQWIQRIQSLQEDSVSPSTSQSETDDDVTQDLIAAFR